VAAIIAAITASTAAGLWAERRFGAGAGRLSRRMLLLVLYFVLPPVTFLNLVNADLGADAGLGIAFGLLSVGILGVSAALIARHVLHLARPAAGALISSVIVVNTGYLGYAVVAALIGFDGLDEAVAYDILVSGPALLIGSFAVGAAFGHSAGEGARERATAFATRNPALFAAAAAFLAPSGLAPHWLVEVSRVVIIGVLPLGFFAVGVALAEGAETGEAALPPRFDRPVATAVALRLIGGPLLLAGLSAAFIDLPNTYLLLAAMPCGLNTMIVAHAYGLELRIAAGAIAWSTAIAVPALAVYALVR
jgi:malate permease and related proteins